MSKKIQVLHLITSLNIGGAEVSLLRLLKAINTDQFSNQVVSLIPFGTLAKNFRELGIPLHSLDMQPGSLSLWGLRRLVALLRKIRPDVLQTWMYHADLLGIVAAALAGIPRVVWNIRAADMGKANYRGLTGAVVKVCSWVSGRPTAVIVNSQAGKSHHKKLGYKPRRWALIPNGIDIDRFSPRRDQRNAIRRELGIHDSALLAGNFARYDEMKDHTTLLQAASKVFANPACHLLLAGPGISMHNAALARLIESLRIGNRVHLLGAQEHLVPLFAALDVYISSSYTEAFPNVIAEAMACGVPCVATDVGDSAITVGETGLLVPAQDADSLAGAWEKMLAYTPQARQGLGDQARARITALFEIHRMAKLYEDLYEQIVSA